ncbi:hypothetical protein HBH56_064780 [Parastagonospora nodorum]|uniref:Uncharacterized protein n=1 Tax=Phaeosphaeria nodorum (strain SN15 / ATCC MYA-4574 / FGSC 10173) TaxID=321614 RepID=A0A7U2HYX4_PHANO|nr:hypothetical protein HBH56_064780 [Parastagonospora nodorum]QRC93207.1 hypothetical protein JI435_403430 [Parastagonospora nodorum SN15]KAH3932727.1 hypothetical protein HBH54_083320 [Parastagonospora nodorum]KAH3988237.1 hypothetical protein HBH51_006760 [Parastagonospora nodorum]KAH4071512.1 hypothetical protein HBH50_081620 [Parastagonospora nodorum]
MMFVMNVSLQMASRFIRYPSASEPPRGLSEAPPQKCLRCVLLPDAAQAQATKCLLSGMTQTHWRLIPPPMPMAGFGEGKAAPRGGNPIG